MAKKKQAELTIEEKLQNALVPKEEQPYKIPNNWCWTRWGNLSDKIQYGVNTPATNEGNARLVRISDIQNNKIIWDKVPYCNIDDKLIEQYLIRENDILFARTGGTVGKSVMAIGVIPNAVFAGYLIRSNYSKKLNGKYLKYFMESNLYWTQLKIGTTATAQPNCNGKTLAKMIFPLSPIDEQQRIVNRIESLFTKLDKAKELIENTLVQFEQNKMAILHKAFTGELTEKWRKENNIDEGTFFHKIKLKNIIKLISGRDVSVNLCNDKSVGIPYILGASNIRDNKFYVERWIENPVVVSEKNDILLSVKGTIGKLYLQKEEKINISRQIMALRALNELNTHYLYYFLLKECERLKFEGNGLIPGISRKDILGLDIVVPTIEEQQEIVNILDKLLVKYSKIKDLEKQLEQIELLKKAILAKAFRGELGTNNPDEESAEVLLKEILAEK
ncbi:restriction endonuclease subunit S [Megamonas hypermegale]|uniref:restriction endonuclease subunit S n=1 Tax=Megamonas hypermegale TaxID=158847 RepID=UPI001957587E|nr:restriction endonuclease subunit S [Megamonas hypermegale]MBM6832558.1 restriction endonuclease subunit S [Megamonas hypermegale]